METVDSRHPQAASRRADSRQYQPGIGPFAEDDAVSMTVAQMRAEHHGSYLNAAKCRYPSSYQICDLTLGEGPEWAIEVKLARVGRDNGTYEDAAMKKILSPYSEDRSAVTDCVKLARSAFACRRAVLIYGFEDPRRPLLRLIQAFEAVAAQHVILGLREEAELRQLVHRVFGSGGVFAWEIMGVVQHPN